MTNLIELKKIVKSYKSKKKITVLNKINFSFKAGKIYSLMGPSGSGKSTLLNLLSLIDTPSSGNLKISGYTVNYSSRSFNDYLRAKKDLKWKPKTNFKDLVKMMIEADLKRN